MSKKFIMDVKKVFGEKFLLSGVKIEVGSVISDCDLFYQDFSKVKLFEKGHKLRIIGMFPSVAIEKCAREVHRLDVESYIMGDKVEVSAVTGDNPFNLCRYSFDKDIENVRLLSEYQGNMFSRQSGFYLENLHLPAKGLIVLDVKNMVKYVEYAENIFDDLNFLEAVRIVKENY